MSIKNELRNKLRTELMSFSKVCNRIEDIQEYQFDYSKEQRNKGKNQNDVVSTYSFLNFCTKHVYVFGGLLLDKKKFSDDMMYNLLCAIADLPLNNFTQKIRSGKNWVTIEAKGYNSLMSSYNEFLEQREAGAVNVVEIPLNTVNEAEAVNVG